MTLEYRLKKHGEAIETTGSFITEGNKRRYSWDHDILYKNWVLNMFLNEMNHVSSAITQLSCDIDHKDYEYAKQSNFGKKAKDVFEQMKKLEKSLVELRYANKDYQK